MIIRPRPRAPVGSGGAGGGPSTPHPRAGPRRHPQRGARSASRASSTSTVAPGGRAVLDRVGRGLVGGQHDAGRALVAPSPRGPGWRRRRRAPGSATAGRRAGARRRRARARSPAHYGGRRRKRHAGGHPAAAATPAGTATGSRRKPRRSSVPPPRGPDDLELVGQRAHDQQAPPVVARGRRRGRRRPAGAPGRPASATRRSHRVGRGLDGHLDPAAGRRAVLDRVGERLGAASTIPRCSSSRATRPARGRRPAARGPAPARTDGPASRRTVISAGAVTGRRLPRVPIATRGRHVPELPPDRPTAGYLAQPHEVHRVVLLYSGGLDTSVMLKWIQDHYDAEVVALCVDLGQPDDDLEAIRRKALDLGAVESLVVDAKETFAHEYVAPAIRANARYQGGYPLFTSLGRPLLARLAVEAAREHGADTMAHGCTGKGNDQVRIEATVLDPGARAQGDRAGARVADGARRGDRLRPGARDPGLLDGRAAVLHRRQPLGPLQRGRRHRGPRPGAAGGRVPPGHAAPAGAGPGRGARDRLPRGAPGEPGRRGARPGRAHPEGGRGRGAQRCGDRGSRGGPGRGAQGP